VPLTGGTGQSGRATPGVERAADVDVVDVDFIVAIVAATAAAAASATAACLGDSVG